LAESRITTGLLTIALRLSLAVTNQAVADAGGAFAFVDVTV
jgi:hypothetical protein